MTENSLLVVVRFVKATPGHSTQAGGYRVNQMGSIVPVCVSMNPIRSWLTATCIVLSAVVPQLTKDIILQHVSDSCTAPGPRKSAVLTKGAVLLDEAFSIDSLAV